MSLSVLDHFNPSGLPLALLNISSVKLDSLTIEIHPGNYIFITVLARKFPISLLENQTRNEKDFAKRCSALAGSVFLTEPKYLATIGLLPNYLISPLIPPSTADSAQDPQAMGYCMYGSPLPNDQILSLEVNRTGNVIEMSVNGEVENVQCEF